MISYVIKPPDPVDWFTGQQLIKKFLSMSVLKATFIYLVCGIAVCRYSNKHPYLNFEEKKHKRDMFFTNYIFLTICSFVACFAIFFVKLILFLCGNRLFSLYGKITLGQVVIFFLIYFSMIIMFNSIVLFTRNLFKESVLAILSPLFLIEIIISIFGITTIFVSEDLGWLQSFLNFMNHGNIDGIINSYSHGDIIEELTIGYQVLNIILMLILTAIFTSLSYISCIRIDLKKIERLYYYEWVRVLWYIIFGAIVCYLITFSTSAAIALYKREISVEKGKYIFNISFLVSTPIFIILEYGVYKIRNRRQNKSLSLENSEDVSVSP